jgi:hypothetical protein
MAVVRIGFVQGWHPQPPTLQLRTDAAKMHRRLKLSATSAGQMQGLGSMAVMCIGFVRCRARHAGRVGIGAWLLDVPEPEPEPDMGLVVAGLVEGFALALAMHPLHLALK